MMILTLHYLLEKRKMFNLIYLGRLDKDDLNTKLGQLSRKIDEVKIEVHDSLNKKYAVFFPMFNSTRMLVSKVDSTRQELEETIAAIEKQV